MSKINIEKNVTLTIKDIDPKLKNKFKKLTHKNNTSMRSELIKYMKEYIYTKGNKND